MKDRVPWHVKGVQRQARDTAREAARRSGMSVGQWLNNLIAQQAGGHAQPAHPSGDWREPGDDQLAETVNRLDRRLDQLITQGRVSGGSNPQPYRPPSGGHHLPPAPNGHYPPPAPNGHYASPLATNHYAPPPPNGHYASPPSGSHYAPPPPNGHYPPSPSSQWSSGVDQAVAEIAARQRALDSDPAAPLPPVDFGYRSAPPQYPPAPPLAPAQYYPDPPRYAAPQPQQSRPQPRPQSEPYVAPQPQHYAAPQAPLQPQSYDAPQSRPYAEPYAASPDLSGLEKQLRHITSQIENLNRPGELTDALTELRKDLAEIGRTLMEAMPRHAVEALENEVRRLAERIDMSREAGVDASTIANMERGLADVREALQTLTPAESLVGFDDAVRGLSRKLDQMALQHDPANLQQLEAAITALRGIVSHVASNDALVGLAEEVRGLSAKVDRVASAAVGPDMMQQGQEQPILNAIERGFAELTSRMVELQNHSLGGSGDAPAIVDHLKRDLARTQDSLEAVHGTLGHLVDRLATIEGGGLRDDTNVPATWPPASAQAAPAPQARPAPPTIQATAMPMVQPPPAPQLQSSPATIPQQSFSEAPAPRAPAAPPAMRERQPIDPNLPPDFPLEPGSGVPRARPQSAAERIAASEAALGGAKPTGANHPGQTNFIAAARRAAQAAIPTADSETPQAEPAKSDKPAKSLTQRMRSLIAGGSAVLVIAASMRIALTLMEPAHEVATEAADPTLQALESIEREQAVTAHQSGLAIKPEGNFAPPSGLILPTDKTIASSTPTTRAPDTDVTGSVAARTALMTPPVTSPEQRPAVSDKLPAALRQAAIAANPAAEYEVALRHLEGRGIPQNVDEAARWLERAAQAGLAPAQFRLGGLYEKGQGVKKNLDTARRHYVAAAEKGNAKAMHNLAVMYSEGVDGKPDYKNAALWFRKAAEHGIADSQYNLGILFARGIGVERNLAESYKWFSLAAAQGDRDAATKRDDVAARIDQGSLMAAKNAVQTFVADPQPDEAITVKSPAGGWDGPSPGQQRPAKKPRPGAPLKVTPS